MSFPSRVLLPRVLLPLIVLCSWALPAHAGAADDPEVARIQHHLDGALELLERGTAERGGALTPAQRARRAGAIASLRAYRDAGVFPHNRDFPGQLVPYFRD